MGKNNLDKAVKDKLYDLNTPIDTSELWSGIQTKMDGDKPDPKPNAAFPFRKYLGLGLLAFMLVGSSYFIYNQLGDSKNRNNSTSATDSNNTSNTSVNEVSAVNKTTNQETSLLSPEREDFETAISSNNLNPNIDASQNSTNSNNKKSKNSTPSNTANQNSSTKSNINSTSATSFTPDQSLYSKQQNNFTNRDSKKGLEVIYGSDKKTSVGTTFTSGKLINEQENQSALSSERNFQNSLLKSLNRLDRKEKVGVSFGRDVVDICGMRDRIDCYDAWTKDNKFSIVPYVGVDFVTNDRIRTDSFANYLQERENTMRFLEVIKAGLLMKYNVTPNLYVKVGAEYDQIREVFESTTVEAFEEVIPDAIIGYKITVEGDTIPVTGPGSQTRIVKTQWRKYNKYHSFNIPVILGFQAPIGNGWAYFTEGGIFYNVRFTYEGTLLDQNNQVVSGENYYLNNTGISLYGALGISYNFNEKIAAFATGSYKYNLEPINNQDFNPIKQNLGLAGIALGLEFRL